MRCSSRRKRTFFFAFCFFSFPFVIAGISFCGANDTTAVQNKKKKKKEICSGSRCNLHTFSVFSWTKWKRNSTLNLNNFFRIFLHNFLLLFCFPFFIYRLVYVQFKCYQDGKKYWKYFSHFPLARSLFAWLMNIYACGNRCEWILKWLYGVVRLFYLLNDSTASNNTAKGER